MPDYLDQYGATLEQLRLLAQQRLADWWANTSGLEPPLRMDTMREAFVAVQRMFGEQAAHAAADYLFMQRSLDEDLAMLEFPEVAEPASYGQAVASFDWATAKYRREFDPWLLPVAQDKLNGVMARLVARPAHDTVAEATLSAGTGYARVPEPGACTFCLMLASRGAVYTRKTVQAANSYHDNCRCVGIEVKNDDELPRINRDLEELWEQAAQRNGGVLSQREFHEALLQRRNG